MIEKIIYKFDHPEAMMLQILRERALRKEGK